MCEGLMDEGAADLTLCLQDVSEELAYLLTVRPLAKQGRPV